MATAKTMSPLRACQVANQLIRRLDTYALIPATDKPAIYINEIEIAALRVLHTVAARAILAKHEHEPKPYRTPGERRDGTLHIPKDKG